MKSQLTVALIALLPLLIAYLLLSGALTGKKYDWNLELTKPRDYEVEIKNVTYLKGNGEIYRYTSMPPHTDWAGYAGGRVMHASPKAVLPDSMKVTWTEVKTGAVYTGGFAFPGEAAVAYWNDNYRLQQGKWGTDYPQGPLAFRLGVAPGGLMTLWFFALDVNTSGFALALGSYQATVTANGAQKAEVFSFDPVFDQRFGAPGFYAPEGENVVAIRVQYHNGELSTLKTKIKSENESILDAVNGQRGWGLAKTIRVTWFDSTDQGYHSYYEVTSAELPDKDTWSKLRRTPVVYLLDRTDAPDAEWNKLPEKHLVSLTRVRLEKI